MIVFIQIWVKNRGYKFWDDVPVERKEFDMDDKLEAVNWCQITANRFNCAIRLTYPPPHLSGLTGYAGSLNGHYFTPKPMKPVNKIPTI